MYILLPQNSSYSYCIKATLFFKNIYNTFINKLQHKLFITVSFIIFHCKITNLKSYDLLKGYINKRMFKKRKFNTK